MAGAVVTTATEWGFGSRSALFHLLGGFGLAVVVGMAAVLKLNVGIHRCGFVTKGGYVVVTAIGVVNGLSAGLFMGGVVVADAAVLKFGHGVGPRRVA